MRKNTFEQALRESVRVVKTKPYDQQSDQEKEMFFARINTLINVRYVVHCFMDNIPHLVAGLPADPKQKELVILKQRMNKVIKGMKELIPFANEASRVFDLVLTASKKADDNLEDAGYLAFDMIRQIHCISLEKFGLLKRAIQMISDGSLRSEHLDKIYQQENRTERD